MSTSREPSPGQRRRYPGAVEFWAVGAECCHRAFPCAGSLLGGIRPSLKDLSVGGCSDHKEHLCSVCGRAQREVTVGCSERSLGEISQSGCVGGPCGDSWCGTPHYWLLPMKAGEGLRDFLILVSCCSAGVPLCHFSGHVSKRSRSPATSALTSQCFREGLEAASLRVPALCPPLLSSGNHSVA